MPTSTGLACICVLNVPQGGALRLRHRVWTSSYLRKMLRKVRSFELSSVGLSDAGTVGGVEAKFMDTVELAAEGTGDAR
jgi:hypothetical protein